MVQVKVWARVGPTEDLALVEEALSGFFPIIEFRLSEVNEVNKKIMEGRGKGREVLESIKQKIWARQILDTAREMLLRRIDGDVTELFIHKQAAYAGRLVLVNRDKESPLGAIHIEIQSGKLEELIDWIAPETFKGRPIGVIKSTQG